MTHMVRNIIIVLGLLGVLAYTNLQIKGAQAIKDEGTTVLLELRPVDPRAFMMGDYMTLRYNQRVYPKSDKDGAPTGTVILKLNENNVAGFARFDDGGSLAENEVRLKYIRKFRGDATYGGERYYFQEGTAETYEEADYGVFKVSESGTALLIGLAGEDFKLLTPESNKAQVTP